ncbi:protein TolR [Alsobacter sp. SYSU M60028]|uniref:Protein TolR n=1 Tax=Alsobacter ponti TaxID=2962936 RepID=A0ABT1LE77_9HYPH|nr:protein TolR [Alsobacter ponti]MCP8939810.1 protein TolR [Alsobacter ponti]
MGMSAAASGAAPSRRRRAGRRHRPMSEINMTPFIDVMLVLLIIFMVAAPLLTVGVPLDLPQTKAAALNIEKQPLTVSVRADGKIYLMETPIGMDEIVPKLQAIAKTAQDDRIYVRGDKAIAYGKVAEVMSVINAAGYRKVALVTEPDQKK